MLHQYFVNLVSHIAPVCLILGPLVALVLVSLPLGLRQAAWTLAVVLSLAQTALLVGGTSLGWPGTTHAPAFFNFPLTVDNLTAVLLLSIGIVTFAALLVARATLPAGDRLSNFASVVFLALAGMNGVVLLQDLFSLYVFLEVTSVSSFVLIAFNKDRGGLEGAFKYLILSAIATMLMIGSIGLLLMVSDGVSFAAIADALANTGGITVARVAVGLFICGLLIKGGLVPFHGWLPGAYSSAPASVSVLLAGIVTKVSGIYALVRLVVTVFPHSESVNLALMIVGTVSIVIGALGALWQSDMKRLFAYSSISQVGYIVLGLGCGTTLGVFGAIFHLFNHSIFKSLLFVNSAAVEQRLGTTDMSKMSGLGSRMPWTSTTSVIALLSTAGVPPLSGFWSKLLIIIALWQAGHFAFVFIAVFFSVVTLGYLLMMHRQVFFGNTPAEFAGVREGSPSLVLAAVVLAAITVGMGVLFPLVLNTFILPMTGIF